MGKHHARIYNQLEDSNLIAICEQNQSVAAEISEKYGCSYETDLDAFFSKNTFDAVSITTPTSTHYDVAKKAIENGCHVLIEKPITDHYKTGLELIDLAEKKGVSIMVGHVERFNPAILVLKELIKEGRIGDIMSLTSKRVGIYPNRIKDANVVIDLAVHDIDIFNDLMGMDPTEVSGNYGSALLENRADYAEVFLKYGDKSGHVQVNWITPVRIRKLSVTGTKAYVDLDYMNQKVTLYESSYSKVKDGDDINIQFSETSPLEIPVPKSEPLVNELSHFLECLKKGESPLSSGQKGCLALKVAEDVSSF